MKNLFSNYATYYLKENEKHLVLDAQLKPNDINKLRDEDIMKKINVITMMSFILNTVEYVSDDDFIKIIVELKNTLFFNSLIEGTENEKLDALLNSIYLEGEEIGKNGGTLE